MIRLQDRLDVNLLKEAIGDIADGLNLDIIYSNIRLSKVPIANSAEKSIESFENIKFPYDKLSIEVGFGSGKHILYQADHNRDELFIGMEDTYTILAQKLFNGQE